MELALTPGMRRATFHLNGITVPNSTLEMASGSITFALALRKALDSFGDSPDYRILSVIVSAWWYKQVAAKDIVDIKYQDDGIVVYHTDGSEAIKFDYEVHNGICITFLSDGSVETVLEEYMTFSGRFLVVTYNKESDLQPDVYWSDSSQGFPYRYRLDWADQPIFFAEAKEMPRKIRENMVYRLDYFSMGGSGEVLEITDKTETYITTNGKCNREQVWNEKFFGQGQLVIEEKIKFCDYDHNNPESNDGFRTIITECSAFVFAHPKEIGAVVLTID